jgi:hypothetical protein
VRRCAGGSLYDRVALLGISIAWGLDLAVSVELPLAPLALAAVLEPFALEPFVVELLAGAVAEGLGAVEEAVGSRALAALARVALIAAMAGAGFE